MTLRRQVITVFAAALLAVSGTGPGPKATTPAPAPPPAPETIVCQEDQACWDWKTMGNHRKGVCLTLRNGGKVDVLISSDDDFYVTTGGHGCDEFFAHNDII